MHGRADPALALAVEAGPQLPSPGRGHTWQRWRWLAAVAAIDLTAGRVAEAHLDALAILAESGCGQEIKAGVRAESTAGWGVFAAEGPEEALRATAMNGGRSWRLTGRKPWCSLADRLSHALITAHTEHGRRLFAIGLRQAGVRVADDPWVSRGLAGVPSGPIELTDVPAIPVGAAGWYLDRPGFAWGGMGVAACWFGGALGVGNSMRARATGGRAPDQLAQMHLGAVDAALYRSRLVLQTAAVAVDTGDAAGSAGVLLALRVRDVVASAAEEILWRVGHSLGPAPLVHDEEHARRVADLTIYLRQHHAERDQAALGRAVLEQGGEWSS